MVFRSGRHFLQLPGPTNVPERVLRAMDRAVIDHRGPEFADLGVCVLEGLKKVFKTSGRRLRIPVLGDRRLGGGTRQHTLAG